MGLIKVTLGGLVGAAIGAFVWVLCAPFIPGVPGLLMLLVGFLAGKGVQKGWGDRELTIFHGLIAATCAITGIVGARYLEINNEIKAAKLEMESYEPSREDIVALLATDMVGEIVKQGQSVESNPIASLSPQPELEITSPSEKTTIDSSWPDDSQATDEVAEEAVPNVEESNLETESVEDVGSGVAPDADKIDEALDAVDGAEATIEAEEVTSKTPKKEDFPEPIWQVADQLYDTIDETQRADFDKVAKLNKSNDLGYGPVLMTEPVEELTKVHLRSSFAKLDLLFMGLAVLIAIKIGSTDPFEYYDE
jgi:hypothetical protein